MTKKTAKPEALEELHNALAKTMKSKLVDGTATAADLNVIRAFLKDNHIEATPEKGNPLGDLADALPDFSAEDIAAEDQTLN